MDDKALTVVEHLDELRRRIIYILLSVAATSGGAYYFIDEILDFVTKIGGIENQFYSLFIE